MCRQISIVRGQAGVRRKAVGFTLIELLVVLVIVALFSGMVVISIGDSMERKLLSEAERLQAVIIAASDEAVYSGNEYGIHLSKEGYLVLRWERLTRQWLVNPAQAFATHKLPEGITVEWRIDGFIPPDESEAVQFELGDETDSEESRALERSRSVAGDGGESLDGEQALDVQPQLLTLSSAELSVFEVDFVPAENSQSRARVRVSSDGFSLPVVSAIDKAAVAALDEPF